MLTPKFKGTVKEGKLILDKQSLYEIYLGNLEGKNIELVIKQEKKTRSIKQNALLWSYYGLIITESGNYHITPQELHDAFKIKFLPPRLIDFRGDELLIPSSSTELSTGEFTDFISQIEAYTGIPCPNPDEFYRD